MANKSGIYYSSKERNYVVKNYLKTTVRDMANELGKTEVSVYGFMRRHGLSKTRTLAKRINDSIKKELRIQRIKDKIELKQLVQSVVDSEECLLLEMKSLINFCEITDNSMLRKIAKNKLVQLSGIPKNNPHAIHTVS